MIILPKKGCMIVLLAIMSPLTLVCDVTKGDLRLIATWILAGPQLMKLANFLSLILCKLLCTLVGSVSPWIIFKILIYLLCLLCVLSIIFLGCNNLRMTSSTVVFLTTDGLSLSNAMGVYPVIK